MDPKLAHPDEKNIDGPPNPQPVQILQGDSSQQLQEKLDTMVRDQAYRFFQDKVNAQGTDLDRWAEAQAKFMSQNVEVRESGPWFHLNCPVRTTPADKILVAIDAAQVMIHLNSEVPADSQPQSDPLFYWAKWPLAVDPSTAAAYVLDRNLTIEVKKTDPPAENPVQPAKKPVT